jgi:hypothetical protein
MWLESGITLCRLILLEASKAQNSMAAVSGKRQNRLRLDPSLELLVQPLDGVGDAGTFPPARHSRVKPLNTVPFAPPIPA